MKPCCRTGLAVMLTIAASASATAHAAERVTLRSGFVVTCNSRETLPGNTVRLHLPGDDGAAIANYMDVAASSITSVEVFLQPAATIVRQPLRTSEILQQSGAAHNVNVALLASVVKAESGGNPHAVSRTGARGLMQLMPSTASELGVTDSFSPEKNVNGGSAYLDRLLTRYHENLALALAAYNAGPAAVDRYRGIPPYRETRLYVAKVIREFNRAVAQDASAAVTPAAATLPQTNR